MFRTLRTALIFILITLIFLELGMRSLGFVLKFEQRLANTRHPQALRIMTLGESTTADYEARVLANGRSWPRILQELLEKRGIHAQVINEGEVGITTTALMARLEELLRQDRPQIVISMMGVNDSPRFWLNEQGFTQRGGFLGHLRVLKLWKLFHNLWRTKNISAFEKPRPKPKPHIDSSTLSIPQANRWIAELRGPHRAQAEAKITNALKDRTPEERAQFYDFVSTAVRPPWRSPISDFEYAGHFERLALENALDVGDSGAVYVWISQKQNHPEQCEWLARRFLDTGTVPQEVEIQRLDECLPIDSPTLQALMSRFGQAYNDRPESTTLPTESNYRFLNARLHEAGICLIAMQYPLTAVSELAHAFDGEASPPILVSNEENFKKALELHSESEIFVDKFAGVFGHATPYGNSLIAESAAAAVAQGLKNGTCSPD